MAMTEAEMQAIAKMVYDMNKNSNQPKISTEWQQLSREIKEYCEANSKGYDDPSYTTIQNAIYNPIKFITGVHRVNTLIGKEVDEARKIFEFIKQQRKEMKP